MNNKKDKPDISDLSKSQKNYFPSNLKYLREQKGITHEEMGLLIGKSTAQIYAYESGSSRPKLEVMMAIATILDVTTGGLIDTDYRSSKPENDANAEAAEQLDYVQYLLRKIMELENEMKDQEENKAVHEKLDALIDKLLTYHPDTAKQLGIK